MQQLIRSNTFVRSGRWCPVVVHIVAANATNYIFVCPFFFFSFLLIPLIFAFIVRWNSSDYKNPDRRKQCTIWCEFFPQIYLILCIGFNIYILDSFIFNLDTSLNYYVHSTITLKTKQIANKSTHNCMFSPGTPASSTTKSDRHDIAEILLKVALNTKIQIQIQIHSLEIWSTSSSH